MLIVIFLYGICQNVRKCCLIALILRCIVAISSIINSTNLVKESIKLILRDSIADWDHLCSCLFQEMDMRSGNILGPLICTILNNSLNWLCDDGPDWCLLRVRDDMLTSISVSIMEYWICWSHYFSTAVITIMMQPLIKWGIIIWPRSWRSWCWANISGVVLKKLLIEKVVDAFPILNWAFRIFWNSALKSIPNRDSWYCLDISSHWAKSSRLCETLAGPNQH